MNRHLIILGLSFFLLLAGCSKQKEILVPDNTPPPDQTVADITIESYTNRVYITLIGRKPEPSEFNTDVATLRGGNFSIAARRTFVESVTQKPGYHQNLFEQGKTQLLDGVDTTDIQEQIFIFNLLTNDPAYQQIWPYLHAEIAKMQEILDIVPDLNANQIDIQDVHRRMVYNYIYDQLNMGTQNFVISCFQNFLDRYPTAAELEDAELMVNGFPSQLFLQSGDSKEDFLDIFLFSNDYYEGIVRGLFSKYLYRTPSSAEMTTFTLEFSQNRDYAAVQTEILITDEFAGI